jgi:hypothetical protein
MIGSSDGSSLHPEAGIGTVVKHFHIEMLVLFLSSLGLHSAHPHLALQLFKMSTTLTYGAY